MTAGDVWPVLGQGPAICCQACPMLCCSTTHLSALLLQSAPACWRRELDFRSCLHLVQWHPTSAAVFICVFTSAGFQSPRVWGSCLVRHMIFKAGLSHSVSISIFVFFPHHVSSNLTENAVECFLSAVVVQ